MTKRLIRVYTELEFDEVVKHLIIIGDLRGTCSNCSHIGIDPNLNRCPNCQADFKYATFTSEKDKGAQMIKMRDKLKNKIFIDYSDFKKSQAEFKIKDFFK
jgi:hypothetical protein